MIEHLDSEQNVTRDTDRDWKQRAFGNVLSFGSAKAVSAVVSLVLAAYLTRVLEPSGYGILGFGSALLSYFVLFVRLGFKHLGAREVARQPVIASQLVGQLLGMQLVLAIVGFAGFAGLVLALPKDAVFKTVLLIQGLSLFAHALSLDWLYQGLERMKVLAICQVASSVLHLVGVLFFVSDPEDIVIAAGMFSAGLAVNSALLIGAFVRGFGGISFSLQIDTWKKYLRPALPIATSTFMVALYFSIDQVLLGFMRTEAEVGLYSAAVKAVSAAQIPAMVLVQVLFPVLSTAIGSRDDMRERSLALARRMFPIGLGSGLIAAFLGTDLIVAFAGSAFEPAGTAFSYLMLNVALIYITMTFGQSLIAWDAQNIYMVVVTAGAVINIVLNVLLIPPHGIEGAAVATLATEAVVLVGLATQHIRMVGFPYWRTLLQTFAALGLGVIIPYVLIVQYHLPLWLDLCILGLTYTGALFLAGLGKALFRWK
ncbi:MAG: flippase [Rubricoccaceae bacterium]|nr:flippase [Rubricoccaceae bacterium]